MAERKVELTFTRTNRDPVEITVSSLEDLESLMAEYGNGIVLTAGEDGKLSGIEIYNDYRE